MKWPIGFVVFVLLVLAALTLRPDLGAQEAPSESTGRPAPEWQVSPQWINSSPLRLADLRGKVVLLDFWTYSCINCLRTIPYLNQWNERYKDRGLVIVGIHTPEFEFEGLHSNVEDAVKRLGIRYAVAQDNDYATWDRYQNVAWPGFYLIDRSGKIALMRYGEGGYDRIENRIRQLLGIDEPVPRDNGTDLSQIRTAEIYLGTAHEDHQARQLSQRVEAAPARGIGDAGDSKSYTLPAALHVDEFAFGGTWARERDRASLVAGSGVIVLRFNAAKVHLVAGSATPVDLVVRVDGGPPQRVTVDRSRLYTLFDGDAYREHSLRVEVSGPGFDAYSFTFG